MSLSKLDPNDWKTFMSGVAVTGMGVSSRLASPIVLTNLGIFGA